MSYDIEICQISKFEKQDGCARASVSFRFGPVLVRGAKILEKEGSRWLSMPCFKTSRGNWIDIVYFPDQNIKQSIQAEALAKYEECLRTSFPLVKRSVSEGSSESCVENGSANSTYSSSYSNADSNEILTCPF